MKVLRKLRVISEDGTTCRARIVDAETGEDLRLPIVDMTIRLNARSGLVTATMDVELLRMDTVVRVEEVSGIKYLNLVDRDDSPRVRDPKRYATSDGKPPMEGLEDAPAPQPINPVTGQHGAYWVLTEAERAKKWIRPLRDSYKHDKCGTVTTTPRAIAETYAREPGFYGSTFCCVCGKHFPVAEFTWTMDGSRVGS